MVIHLHQCANRRFRRFGRSGRSFGFDRCLHWLQHWAAAQIGLQENRAPYRHGGAAALAAIFQAPITGVVFALEVLMIDLSLGALVPIIVSSFVAILTSYFLLGQAVEYPTAISEGFIPTNAIFYIGLGLFAGLISAYFLKVTFSVEKRFKHIESPWKRFFLGATLLGLLIYLFPALYGEGYEAINKALAGDYSPIFGNPFLARFKGIDWITLVLFLGIILLKAFATAFTFGAGGVGGTFAPALFIGAFTGLFFALAINYLGIGNLDPAKFALVGMSGLVAGMLHAPLTGIFLIAEITNGYALIVPLMIVATLSYAVNHIFSNIPFTRMPSLKKVSRLRTTKIRVYST